MDAKEAKRYRGQIVINTEEELFYPSLTVGRTMDFATRNKVPATLPSDKSSPEDWRVAHKEFLLDSMQISHTADTKVGDAFVRGVSGGERKRVSIIETLATKASVLCWDNSTRGLDASNALEFTKALRAMTDEWQNTTVVTLYQPGNAIYNLFDKVLVLDEGKQVFYGPRSEARPFMEALGFYCDNAANIADYLTGVTVPNERQIRPGFEDRFPRNASEIRDAYERTDTKTLMEAELDYSSSEEAKSGTEQFKRAVQMDKAKGPGMKSAPTTVSPPQQIIANIKRQYQIIWGDKPTFFIKQGLSLIQALVAGSLFYSAPANSSGLFTKGGAMFFSLLYNSITAMSEVTDSFAGRPILAKHKAFAFYHPAAFCLAQVTADIPILFIQVTLFDVVIYFMVGLKQTAGAFFTFWFVTYLTAIVITAFFRMTGAAFKTFDAASKVSGFSVSALIMFVGYMQAKPQMHDWFVWIFWISESWWSSYHDCMLTCFQIHWPMPSKPLWAMNSKGKTSLAQTRI